MGQPCCKIDETKVAKPSPICDTKSPRPLLDEEQMMSIESNRAPNCINLKPSKSEEDHSTTKEDFISASGSKHLDSLRRTYQYKRGDLLDSNHDFIETWECLDLYTGERLAVKSYEVLGDIEKTREDLENLQDEIYMWRELRHVNLIKCYDIDLNQNPDDNQKYNIDVVMEYASGGSIESLVCKFNSLDEKITQYYTRQVLEGLAYLHSKGSVHGNIRGSNILIDSNGVVKLTDFELANKIKNIAQEDLSEDNQIQDSVLWAAPEVLTENRIETSADVWSVGCVVIEMLTGNQPWMPMDKMDAFKSIISGGSPPIPKDLSENCRDFLNEAFRYPPEDRPTISELLDHPFIGQFKNTDASCLGESFLTLQTIRGNGLFQSMATLPRHPSSDSHAIDNPSRARISLSHMNIIRAKTLKRRDSKLLEGVSEEQMEVPSKYKRNISAFQSRESFRRQITLPEVHETNYDDEEEDDNVNNDKKRIRSRQSKYWPSAYVKRTVLEIHTEESLEHKDSALRSLDLGLKQGKADDRKGQIIFSDGDFLEANFDIHTEIDNVEGDNIEPTMNEIEKSKSLENGSVHMLGKQNQKTKGRILNQEEERKANQPHRIETKDLNREIFNSSDKTINKLGSIHSQEIKPPVDDREAARKRFEEELLGQLDRVESKDLSVISGSGADDLNAERDFSVNRGI